MLIDYVDNLQISSEDAKKHSNEINSLRCLASGLWFLYDQILNTETQIAERIPKNKRISYFGNAPDLEGVPQDLVTCSFHWYAVTVCNYVKMVGWLANNGNSNKALEYVKHILPEVYLWRNKVAAHFAIIDPEKDPTKKNFDTAADLAIGVISQIPYEHDAFYAGSLTLSLTTGNMRSSSRQDMRWSLTDTHKKLIPRYWPSKEPIKQI
jgi:hypothetical protein